MPEGERMSNEARALIDYRPPWIIRRSSVFFVMILVAVLSAASLVPYPSVVIGVCRIAPGNRAGSGYVGLLTLPAAERSQLRPGQRVLIRLEDYPSDQYGYLIGTVEAIDRRDSAPVVVGLPPVPVTSFQRSIVLRDGLPGEAEVVVNGGRLIDRLAGRFTLFSAGRNK
jgi:hypothetical protein